jgi:hypothetical protein
MVLMWTFLISRLTTHPGHRWMHVGGWQKYLLLLRLLIAISTWIGHVHVFGRAFQDTVLRICNAMWLKVSADLISK